MSSARLFTMFGAGAGGAGLAMNYDVVLERLRDVLGKMGSRPAGDGQVRALAQQVSTLATKMDRLPAAGPTIVVGDRAGGGPLRILAAAAACGVCYAKARGLGWEDVRPVTARALGQAVESVGASLTAVSDLVGAVRDALAERLDSVSRTVDGLGDELGEVHDELADVHDDVLATRAVVDDIQRKQDYTARGIHALCSAVSELTAGAAPTAALENLRRFNLLASSEPPAALKDGD